MATTDPIAILAFVALSAAPFVVPIVYLARIVEMRRVSLLSLLYIVTIECIALAVAMGIPTLWSK